MLNRARAMHGAKKSHWREEELNPKSFMILTNSMADLWYGGREKHFVIWGGVEEEEEGEEEEERKNIIF